MEDPSAGDEEGSEEENAIREEGKDGAFEDALLFSVLAEELSREQHTAFRCVAALQGLAWTEVRRVSICVENEQAAVSELDVEGCGGGFGAGVAGGDDGSGKGDGVLAVLLQQERDSNGDEGQAYAGVTEEFCAALLG